MRPGTEARRLQKRRLAQSGRRIVGYVAYGWITLSRAKASAAMMRSAIGLGEPISYAGRAVAFLRCGPLFSKDESVALQSVRLAAGNH